MLLQKYSTVPWGGSSPLPSQVINPAWVDLLLQIYLEAFGQRAILRKKMGDIV
jgi:hypothetical protein